MPDDEHKLPQVTPVTPPQKVPVFNCLVYVSQLEDGRVRARSGFLAELVCEAPNEREALQKLASAFKARALAAHEAGRSLPLDQPLERAEHENERLLPVHL